MKNIQEGQANCSFNNESIINIDPMNELSQMIGITKIKETLEQLLNKIQLDKERSLFGLPVNQNSLHSVFLGNNGLGKTRVINLFGKIFKKHKILSTGLVYYESAKSLVCESVSEMKTRLQTAVDRSQGGILYIYDIFYFDKNDEKTQINTLELLSQILKENNSSDWMLVLSDSPTNIQKFLKSDNFLSEKLSNFYYFEDQSPDDLSQIAEEFFLQNNYTLTEGAKKQLGIITRFICNDNDKTYANPSYIKSLIKHDILPSMAERVMEQKSIKESDFMTIIEEDLPSRAMLYISESMNRLKEIVGFSNIKKFKTQEHLTFINFLKKRLELGITTEIPPLHMIFAGENMNEKLIIADYLSSYYNSIGILSKGKIISCDYLSLLGSDLENTNNLVLNKLNASKGNILIINIPKNLFAHNSNNNAPIESMTLQLLWSQLGRFHNDLIVVLSGSPEDIKKILSASFELKYRFPYLSLFDNYKLSELKEYIYKFATKDHNIFKMNNKYALSKS